jgi:hypothetical protein
MSKYSDREAVDREALELGCGQSGEPLQSPLVELAPAAAHRLAKPSQFPKPSSLLGLPRMGNQWDEGLFAGGGPEQGWARLALMLLDAGALQEQDLMAAPSERKKRAASVLHRGWQDLVLKGLQSWVTQRTGANKQLCLSLVVERSAEDILDCELTGQVTTALDEALGFDHRSPHFGLVLVIGYSNLLHVGSAYAALEAQSQGLGQAVLCGLEHLGSLASVLTGNRLLEESAGIYWCGEDSEIEWAKGHLPDGCGQDEVEAFLRDEYGGPSRGEIDDAQVRCHVVATEATAALTAFLEKNPPGWASDVAALALRGFDLRGLPSTWPLIEAIDEYVGGGLECDGFGAVVTCSPSLESEGRTRSLVLRVLDDLAEQRYQGDFSCREWLHIGGIDLDADLGGLSRFEARWGDLLKGLGALESLLDLLVNVPTQVAAKSGYESGVEATEA